jgi:hypothetical protein
LETAAALMDAVGTLLRSSTLPGAVAWPRFGGTSSDGWASVVQTSVRRRGLEHSMDETRAFLRHTVATVAYRGGKAIRDAPASFATYTPDGTPRTPARILAHINDLYDWALTQAQGTEAWHDSAPLAWDDEVERFHATLARFDAYLASDAPLAAPVEKLFQGAIADSLTHVGQLTLLRRLAGARMKSENYSRAEIVAGRVGPAQTPPRREFD